MQLIRGYLQRPLTLGISLDRQFALLGLAFLLTAASVLLVHLWLPGPQPPLLVLIHAVQVALAYTVALALLGWLLQHLHRRWRFRGIRVWHLWALSFACYILGFLLHASHDTLTVQLHQDVDSGGSLHHFLRLLPLWVLVTALLIQPWVTAAPKPPSAARVRIESGRKRLDLPAAAVTHILVDDHHCYLHYVRNGTALKTDIGLPLKDLLPALPEQFVQIHRSHVVNLDAVTHVSRHGRRYHAHLANGSDPLPISRQRLPQVLPRLEARDA